MPELSCKHPSHDELQSYLSEHWETTKLVNYYRNDFGIDCQKLYAKLYDSILSSLYRLNDFSREDKFWRNTNEKPTIYKLNEFCRIKLYENQNDVLALWTILALVIKDSAPEDDFSQIIQKLFELGELGSDMLIEMYLTEDIIYDGEGENLASWLRKFGFQREAKTTLNNLVTSQNEFVSNWTAKVLKRIENQ